MSDNARLSLIICPRQARRFWRISIEQSAAMIHRVFDDSSPRTRPAFSSLAARQRRRRPAAPVPGWLRGAVPDAQGLGSQGLGDVALVAGAAIGALDAVVRRPERWAGAWRQRLALAAAAETARQAALRDAVLLTRPGRSSAACVAAALERRAKRLLGIAPKLRARG